MGNALGSLAFFVVAPGTVLVFLPLLLGLWRSEPPMLGSEATRYAGALLALAGPIAVIESFVRFVREGEGTPNSASAPQRLVVGGAYRWVRNPMYVALVAALIGEALAFGNAWLLAYAAAVWLAFHLRVLLNEEPVLRARFGAEYDAYRARVPRWVPRRPR